MAVINGTGNADVIEPGNNPAGNDPLTGADIINGLGGNDFLSGGLGADTLNGGGGSDTLDGVDGGDADVLNGGIGTDFADYRTAAGPLTINLSGTGPATSGEAAADTFISIEGFLGALSFGNTMIGSGGTDYFYGGNQSDTLSGLGGIDVLEGRGGDDFLIGGADIDVLNGGLGDDTLTGSEGSDQFYFEGGDLTGDDVITDFEIGSDKIVLYNSARSAGELINSLFTLARQNPDQEAVMNTGEGGTVTFAGVSVLDLALEVFNTRSVESVFLFENTPAPGVESAFGNMIAGTVILDAGIGNDRLDGTTFGDYIDAGAGNDLVRGGRGDDNLVGGEGNDRLFGQGGNDILDGGAGADILHAGAGENIFVFGDGDTVLRFSFANAVDQIAFNASLDAEFDDLEIRQENGDTIIELDGAEMVLRDFTGTLTEEDFIFTFDPDAIDPELLL